MFNKMIFAGIAVGALAGFLYWNYVGCANGTCAITSNKYMSIVYGAVMGGLLFSSFNFSKQKQETMYQNVNAEQFAQKINEPNMVLLDVRTEGESKEGYIPGTTHFINIMSMDFGKKISQLDKSKTYLVYCRSGARSAQACSTMEKQGFTSIYNLSGGIGSWRGNIERK